MRNVYDDQRNDVIGIQWDGKAVSLGFKYRGMQRVFRGLYLRGVKQCTI